MAKEGKGGIRLEARDWKDYRRWGNAVARTDALSCEDLVKWQKRATVEFFTQPKLIWYYGKKWMTLRYSDYYLRPFRNALKDRLRCMLKNDFELQTL
jgi:hypothetical protein